MAGAEPQYQPVVTDHPGEQLRHKLSIFLWRTLLGVFWPLGFFAYYALISFYYLNQPPVNDVVQSNHLRHAKTIFYGWFVVSIFVLDWARSTLAHFEAAAVMRPQLAPSTAMKLMWHADSQWTNVLCWLKAICYSVAGRKARPGRLWIGLSITSLLTFVAVPLGGLTMEVGTVWIKSSTPAAILGPRPDTFNFKGMINVPALARARWRGGATTTPSDASIFYAPEGTPNASQTYFSDQIMLPNNSGPVKVFLGPAVNQYVAGNAWGMEADVDCQQVHRDKLQLLQVRGYGNYNISKVDLESGGLPLYRETGFFWDKALFELLVVADGTWYGDSPYDSESNHDFETLDSFNNKTIETEVTTGLLEVYLWQGWNPHILQDSTMQELLDDESGLVNKDQPEVNLNITNTPETVFMAGFSIQCKVKSAVGNATISPSSRTYTNFRRGTKATATGGDQDTYPLQIQAAEALGNWDQLGYTMKGYDGGTTDSTWLAFHGATDLSPQVNSSELPNYFGSSGAASYPALTPQNITIAANKLLGEIMIAIMASGGQQSWTGELYGLEQTAYLVPGTIPWQLVFGLLALWAVIVLLGSCWTGFNRRWSATLGSFEFFKLGAQHQQEVNQFNGEKFQSCTVLTRMPGMLGVIPGENKDSNDGFIGLSRRAAHFDGTFVSDRTQAGKNAV